MILVEFEELIKDVVNLFRVHLQL